MAVPKLPKRFQPFVSQALNEAAIRYGSQESALGQLRGQAQHDYAQGLLAQTTATRSLLGSLNLAPQEISNAYSAVGLSSPLLASMAQSGSPTAQRIAAEQASAQAAVVQQRLGAQAGQIAGVNRLTDQYNQDVGNIGSQFTALEREKGAFTQGLVDQLISSDRATRHAANQEIKKEQFTAGQNTQQQNAALQRALIGQGLTPVVNPDGTVSIGAPIPGSKANRPKVTRATPGQQSGAETDFGSALNNAQQMAAGGTDLNTIAQKLREGRPAAPAKPGRPVYVTIKTPTGATKQQRKLNPDGTPVLRGGSKVVPAIPGVDQAIAQAAAEQAVNGYVSNATIKKLHHLGYRVLDFPHLVTQRQARHRGTGGYSPAGSSVSPYAPGSRTNVK